MKKNISCLIVGALVFGLLSPATVSVSQAKEPDKSLQSGDYLVQFKNLELGKQALSKRNKKIGKTFKHNSFVTVQDLSVADRDALMSDSNVVLVEPDQVISAEGDTMTPSLEQIHVPEAEKMNVYGAGVKVAVLDTGIDATSKELKVAGGVSFVEEEATVQDINGHGTHVAGILAALQDDQGMIGVAPQVDLYAVKVMNAQGRGTYSQLIQGLEWAIDNHMDIVSMSLSGVNDSQVLHQVIQTAATQNIVLVGAAGNDGGTTLSYPAKYEEVIAVGAVDGKNQHPTFSNTGQELDLVAPGVDVQSLGLGGTYRTKSGTSMAVPQVAGVAALVKAKNPSFSANQIRRQLEATATPLGYVSEFGKGLVNAEAALTKTVPQDNQEPQTKPQEPSNGQDTSADAIITSTEGAPTATPLQFGQDIQGTLNPIWWEDQYFSFSTDEFTSLVQVGFSGNNSDAWFHYEIHDENNQVIFTDESYSGGSVKVVPNSKYYLTLRGTYTPWDEDWSYVLGITAIDANEPNDTEDEATSITIPSTIKADARSATRLPDEDYYTFTPTQTGSITAKVSPIPAIEVYTIVNGNRMNVTDNGIDELPEDRNGTLVIDVKAGTKYYLHATKLTEPYTIQLNDSIPDVHEVDGGLSQAYPLNVDSVESSYLSNPWDTDLYTFKASATSGQTVLLKGPDQSDYTLSVFKADNSPNLTIQTGTDGEQYVYIPKDPNKATLYAGVDSPSNAYSATPYTVSLFNVNEDYEPNNSDAQAVGIGNNGTINAALSFSSDVDTYTFLASSTGLQTIQLSGKADNLTVYSKDTNGQIKVLSNDLNNPQSSGNDIKVPVILNNTYYVKVTSTTKAIGDYALTIGTVTPDFHEPDNTSSMAKSMTVGLGEVSILSYDGDVDWYSFTSSSTTNQMITMEASDSMDYGIEVYSSPSTLVYKSPEGTTGVRRFFINKGTPKSYWIKVISNSGKGSISNPYKLTVAASNDNYEPNDTEASAYSLIDQDISLFAAISYVGDVDYYQYTATSTGVYKFTTPSGYNLDINTGNKTTKNVTSLISTEPTLIVSGNERYFPMIANQKYYFVISNSNNTTGSYMLQVTKVSDDNHEPDNTKLQAKLITPGTQEDSYIAYPGDVDYYTFPISSTGDQVITLDIVADSGVKMDVTKADGTSYGTLQVASPTRQQLFISKDLNNSKLYVRITSNNSSAVNPVYHLTVKNLTESYEPNGSINTAYGIQEAIAYNSLLGTVNDVDTFKFTASKTNRYHLSVMTPSTNTFTVQVFDQSGRLIGKGRSGRGVQQEIEFDTQAAGIYYFQISDVNGERTADLYKFAVTQSYGVYTYDSANHLLKYEVYRGLNHYRIDYTYDDNGALLQQIKTNL